MTSQHVADLKFRFALIGLNVDPTPSGAKKYVAAKSIPWPQTRAPNSQYVFRAWFPLARQSSAFLIGPDGKVIATRLSADQIKAAVDKALGQ